MRNFAPKKVAMLAAGTATAMVVGLASPVQATAAGITPPSAGELQAIVNCVIAVVDQLVLGGRPDPSDCAALPGGV